jgi:hypothetical protein
LLSVAEHQRSDSFVRSIALLISIVQRQLVVIAGCLNLLKRNPAFSATSFRAGAAVLDAKPGLRIETGTTVGVPVGQNLRSCWSRQGDVLVGEDAKTPYHSPHVASTASAAVGFCSIR